MQTPPSVHIAITSFKKRKVQTEDIDTYCDNNNLDKKARKDRYKASQSLVIVQRERWAAHQQAIADSLLAAWTLIALINLLSR
jgi:retron-type reverse transcriptase